MKWQCSGFFWGTPAANFFGIPLGTLGYTLGILNKIAWQYILFIKSPKVPSENRTQDSCDDVANI